jgi:hypothetical protein
MEEVTWDRNSFVTKPPAEPPRRSSIMGPVLFGILLWIAGAGGYFYFKYNGVPRIGAPDSQMTELTARLDDIATRLERLEKRPAAAVRPINSTAPPSPVPAPTGSSSSAVTPARRAETVPHPSHQPPAVPPQSTPSSAEVSRTLQSSAGAPSAAQPSLESELASHRDIWEATTNRLGEAVGELGNQRREIASTQQTLEQIQRNFERTYLPFDLRRNSGRQQIGPIWLDLRSVDRRAQRFTIRLFVDDRWVEMKDRVLGERLEFYVRGFASPLELVISEIRQDQVSGQLGLPPDGLPR